MPSDRIDPLFHSPLELTRCERCGLYWSMHLLLGCPERDDEESESDDAE